MPWLRSFASPLASLPRQAPRRSPAASYWCTPACRLYEPWHIGFLSCQYSVCQSDGCRHPSHRSWGGSRSDRRCPLKLRCLILSTASLNLDIGSPMTRRQSTMLCKTSKPISSASSFSGSSNCLFWRLRAEHRRSPREGLDLQSPPSPPRSKARQHIGSALRSSRQPFGLHRSYGPEMCRR